MPSAMVTFNGRITLPPNVRKQLGLKTGDSVDFVELGKGRFAIRHCANTAPDPEGWMPELSFEAAGDDPDPTLN
jgi:AbrB family looped-hinge helix DNA binding protein